MYKLLLPILLLISCGSDPDECFVCETTTDSNKAVYDDCIGLETYTGPEWVLIEYNITDTFCDSAIIEQLKAVERDVTLGSVDCPFTTRTYVECREI